MNTRDCCGINTNNPCVDCPAYGPGPISGGCGYAPSQAPPAYDSYVRAREEDAKRNEYVRQMEEKMDKQKLMQQGYSSAPEAPVDTRANVEGFLLYIQGYQDALDIFSSMLEEVIGE